MDHLIDVGGCDDHVRSLRVVQESLTVDHGGYAQGNHPAAHRFFCDMGSVVFRSGAGSDAGIGDLDGGVHTLQFSGSQRIHHDENFWMHQIDQPTDQICGFDSGLSHDPGMDGRHIGHAAVAFRFVGEKEMACDPDFGNGMWSKSIGSDLFVSDPCNQHFQPVVEGDQLSKFCGNRFAGGFCSAQLFAEEFRSFDGDVGSAGFVKLK